MQSLCKLGCGGMGMVDETSWETQHYVLIFVTLYVICVSALHACMCVMCLEQRRVLLTTAPPSFPTIDFQTKYCGCFFSVIRLNIHSLVSLYAGYSLTVSYLSTFPLFCEAGSLTENLLD